jgi:hypothetical protein
MAGLDLVTFLRLLRADVGAWVTLGLIVLFLALMTWTSWGSRKALRKCLVLSIIAHGGLVLYGSTVPMIRNLIQRRPIAEALEPKPERIRRITLVSEADVGEEGALASDGSAGPSISPWDRIAPEHDSLASIDPDLRPARPTSPTDGTVERFVELPLTPPTEATPPALEAPIPSPPEERGDALPAEPSPATGAVVAVEAEEALDLGRPAPTRPGTDLDLAPDPGPLRPDPERTTGLRPTAPDLEARPELPSAERPNPRIPIEARNLPREAPPIAQPAEAEVSEGAPRARLGGSESSAAVLAMPGVNDLRTRAGSSPSAEAVAIPSPTVLPPLSPATAPTQPSEPSATTAPPGNLDQRTAARPEPSLPGLPSPAAPEIASAEPARPRSSANSTPLPVAEIDLRARLSPSPGAPEAVPPEVARNMVTRSTAIPVDRATPPAPRLPTTPGMTTRRPLAAVPEVYRSRLDPDRSARAVRAGASPASEQAVERALDWLQRHQDADGRWNGGAARYNDGTVAQGEDSFTVHCPPGEVCFGECFYAEADTALTGLALLAYLGAGYTHLDGQYTQVVSKGLAFLIQSQKPDGDLRGMSRAVGMYCHAMASLALCEAYALTGDRRLREPVEKAVTFAVNARAADGLAWRYLPGDPRGSDTSILGWVVMVLKSAREVGIAVPPTATAGAVSWLDKVAGGRVGGLARYQPRELARSQRDGEITPSMTAEAWVCRQFLGLGGPGPASDEAAQYLLNSNPARGPFNIYYWYYGTLAMYQHGGEPWDRWNVPLRDQLVRRQRVQGHQAGSWDPDETDYGARGGRIYCTALSTLTLEVYYRYLRLYDDPATPPPMLAPKPTSDPPVRRASAAGTSR